MRFIKYTSKGNTVGLEEDIESYWELNSEGYITRSIEVLPDGNLLKYSEVHDADSFGQLPEGITSEENLTDKSFGDCLKITNLEFEDIWSKKSKNLD